MMTSHASQELLNFIFMPLLLNCDSLNCNFSSYISRYFNKGKGGLSYSVLLFVGFHKNVNEKTEGKVRHFDR